MIVFWNILEFSFYISYVIPLLPELEKGRSGTVMGDSFSHVSLQDHSWIQQLFLSYLGGRSIYQQIITNFSERVDYKSHIISESRDKEWQMTVHSLSEINCHRQFSPLPKIKPGTHRLQIQCSPNWAKRTI